MTWLEAVVELACKAPDQEVRAMAADVVLHPPIFYQEGLVDPKDLEALPMLAVPVFGEPATTVRIGGMAP